MPTTINGIGTMYYGKRNFRREPGVCEFCGHETQLETYETRLWFTILYIPLIPLGWKQILGHCRVCTGHQVVPLGEWHRAEEDTIKAAMEKFRRHPNDAEAAVQLLGTLGAFGRNEQASQLAEILARDFPDNAEVQLQLGAWQASQGFMGKADACFQKAFELDPNNSMTRRAEAIRLLEEGQLDEARQTLAFMMKPGAEKDTVLLSLLADAYQDRGDHAEASELHRVILADNPALARDRAFRRRVTRSEKILGHPDTMLPHVPWNFRGIGIALAIVALIIFAVFGISWYGARTQRLHVVNGFDVPVRVAIDGRSPEEVVAGQRVTVFVAEGKHQATVERVVDGQVARRRAKAEREVIDFEIENGFFGRLGSKSVFVLNPGSAATLIWEKAEYCENPDPNTCNPYRIHFGRSFWVFRNIDYPFQEFPEKLSGHGSRATKTRLEVLNFPPSQILQGFPEGTSAERLLDFAEQQLALHPNDDNLLTLYYTLAVGKHQEKRCLAFLEAGLSCRPVAVDWHRYYQELGETEGRTDAMGRQYDEMLAAEPGNSALLYLRGRLCPIARDGNRFFERAIEADPKNAYPKYALAYHRVAWGELAEARPLCAEACRLCPENMAMAGLFYGVRFALGEYAELEAEIRNAQIEAPLDVSLHQKLLAILFADARQPKAHTVYLEYQRQVKQAGDPFHLGVYSSLAYHYLFGDMRAFLHNAQEIRSITDSAEWVVLAQHELGYPDRAETLLESQPELVDFYQAALMSLAWRQKGNTKKADAWREKTIVQLEVGDADDRKAAALLRSQEGWDLQDLDNVTLPREFLLPVLVLLADMSQEHRGPLLQRAEKLNSASILFPHRFIRSAIRRIGGPR